MKNLIYILFFFILSFFSCSKLDIDRVNIVSSDELLVNSNSVSAIGNIVDINSQGIDSYGHCWSTTNSPTINDSKSELIGAEPGNSFTTNLDGLLFNTTYYLRSYSTNNSETIYSPEESFKITDPSSIQISISSSTIIDENTIEFETSITGLNSLKALELGICWDSTSLPNINSNKIYDEEILYDTNINFSIGNLSQETPYYFRLYLILDENTVLYSNEIQLTIDQLNIITGSYSQTGQSVTVIGDITSIGALPIIDHGHCWSYTNPNPIINDNLLSKGPTSSTGQFFNSINLISGNPITYYYRAYAIKQNSVIVYGNVQSFTL